MFESSRLKKKKKFWRRNLTWKFEGRGEEVGGYLIYYFYIKLTFMELYAKSAWTCSMEHPLAFLHCSPLDGFLSLSKYSLHLIKWLIFAPVLMSFKFPPLAVFLPHILWVTSSTHGFNNLNSTFCFKQLAYISNSCFL